MDVAQTRQHIPDLVGILSNDGTTELPVQSSASADSKSLSIDLAKPTSDLGTRDYEQEVDPISLPPTNSLLGVTIMRDGRPYIRITHVLGKGGFGTAYGGVDLQLYERPVVVKVTSKGGGADADRAALRFEREIKVTASMRFPYAVQAYGMGEYEGQTYLVLELAPGTGLDAFIDARWKKAQMTPSAYPDYVREVITLMKDVIQVMQFAHNRDVVHRDVKPSNVVYLPPKDSEHARVKVLDFGIAKLADVAEFPNSGREPQQCTESITCAHSALGTVQYMAPEQFLDAASVDGRADVYALGVMLYELLSGKRPFAGAVPSTILGVQKAKLAENYPSLVEVLKDLGLPVDQKLQELGSIIAKCLRPLPSNDDVLAGRRAPRRYRYESADALLKDLERWEKRDRVHAHIEARGYGTLDTLRRRPRLIFATFSLLASIGAGAGLYASWKVQTENDRITASQRTEAELIKKTVTAQIERGRVHLEKGRYAEAVIELQKAAEISDGRFADLNERARVMHGLAAAALDMDQATRLPGDSFNKYSPKLATRLTNAERKSAEAMAMLAASEDLGNLLPPEYVRRFGELRREVALTLVNLTEGPNRLVALEQARALTAALGNDPAVAIDIRILEIQLEFSDRPMLERRQKGVPQLRELLRDQTLNPMTRWRAAAAFLKLDAPDEAAKLLTPLVTNDPTFVRALKSMADLCALEGRFDDEVTYLGMASAALPDEAGLVALHSFGVLRKGEREKSAPIANAYYDQAFALADRAIGLDPKLHIPYMTKGRIYLKRNMLSEGEAQIAIAYDLRPDASAAIQLGELAFRRDDFGKMLEYIRKQPETTCSDSEDSGKLAVLSARLWSKVRSGMEVKGNDPLALEKELSDRCIRYLQYYRDLGGNLDALLKRFNATLRPFLAVPDHRRRLELGPTAT